MSLPCITVVTKADAENAKPDDVAAEIRARLKAPTAIMELSIGEGPTFEGVVALRTKKAWLNKSEGPNLGPAPEIPSAIVKRFETARSKLVDDVAGTNDTLTEKYLTDGDLTQQELDAGMREAVALGTLMPIYFASGTRPNGIGALLDAIVELVPPPNARLAWKGMIPGKLTPAERAPAPASPTAAFVFKTSIDQHAGRTSFVRVLSGTLKPDTTLLNASTGNPERLGKIFSVVGKEQKALDEVYAGDIVALAKLKATLSGHTLCDERAPFLADAPEVPPALFSRGVRFEGKGAEEKVGTALHRLTEEDPGLQIALDETTRELRRLRSRCAAPRDNRGAHPTSRGRRLPPGPAPYRLQGNDHQEGRRDRREAQEAIRRSRPVRRLLHRHGAVEAGRRLRFRGRHRGRIDSKAVYPFGREGRCQVHGQGLPRGLPAG